MDNEFLPCPRCGGESGIQPRDKNDYLPHCKKCPCMLKPLIPYKTKEEAITAWNARAEPEPKPLTLDELRECNWVWIDNDTAMLNKGYAQIIKSAKSARLCGCIDYYFEDYGKTWLAYDREVKGDRNDG